MAKGSRRPKSLLLAGTQFLCFGEFLLYKGGSLYSINSVETIEVFYNIRTSLDKLEYAVHITKIINDVTLEPSQSFVVESVRFASAELPDVVFTIIFEGGEYERSKRIE